MKISKEDIENVESDLNSTFEQAKENKEIALSEQTKNDIKKIILGRHVTFRYIFITALASKQSLDINPLALQSKSLLPGAYDARSIAHKVIVPFEKKYLTIPGGKGALGGSNEPFLNKPARFKELSLNNPVRSGNDKNELKILIHLLTPITSEDAHEYLLFSLFLLLEKKKSEENKIENEKEQVKRKTILPANFKEFLTSILSQNDAGQSLPLVIGTVFYAVLDQFDSTRELKVKIHKVNEAGASSLEVGDIDIYESDRLITTIEAKDKEFQSADVVHAAIKAVQGNLNHFYFIYHNTRKEICELQSIKRDCINMGCEVTIITIDQFIDFMFGLLNKVNFEKTSKFIIDSMDQMAVTDTFSRRVISLISKYSV
ncbi:MAG: restriction endonuclease, SacI family [Lactobacillus johnsonii]|nr:restriction endonuclease, SacI family [Lactobacillus johnsonii]MDY4183147.1 restriction endonuclease, SacI family [Candidatus Onthovivens sp.]